jgi:hypothetical protein
MSTAWRWLVLILALLLARPGWADSVVSPTACSPYKGLVTLNELRIGASGKSSSSNQIELFNGGNVAESIWKTWQLVVYRKNGSSGSPRKMGGYYLSSGFTASDQFIYNNAKSVYLRNRNSRYVDVALIDSSGRLIDYIALESRIQTPPACFGASVVVDLTSSKSTSGDIPRLPDGGTWPASVSNTSSHTIGRSNVCTLGGNDLSVTQSVDASSPIVNVTRVTYEIGVLNKSCSGSIAGVALNISGISAGNFSGLTYDRGAGSTSQGANSLTWNVGALAAGASATLEVSGIPKVLGPLTTTAAISAPSGGLVNTGDDSESGTIVVRDYNDVGFELDAVTLTEGNDADYSASVVASSIPSKPITVYYTVSGTAGAGDTNLPASGSVVIDPTDEEAPDQATIDFSIKNDSLYEPPKSITLTITGVSSADPYVRLEDAAKTLNITLLDDDEAAPVAAWHLEEAAWNGVAGEVRDSGDNGLHGVAVNGAATANATPARSGNPGTCGYGAFRSASKHYVRIPYDSRLNPAGDFTISLWARVEGGAGIWRSPITSRDFNGSLVSGYNLYAGTNNRWQFWTGSGTSAWDQLNGPSVALNTWEHLVASFAATSGPDANGSFTGTKTLYVNGVSVASAVGRYKPNARQPLHIGTGGNPGNFELYPFEGLVDEVRVYNVALEPSQVTEIYRETHPCALISSGPAALNAVDVGADAVSGQITTKTAGSGFNLDLYALNAGRTAQDSGASGDVLVDLLANTTTGVALDADNCPLTATTLPVGTASLAAGKATVAFAAVADSWRDVRVRMRYPASGAATVTACSADNFAVKPAALSAIASHTDWQTAGNTTTLANSGTVGGVVHKAARPFSIRVSGYNAAGSLTSNYDGSPTATTTCVLPASGCVTGSFSTGTFNAAGGTAVSNSASYSEVGAIAATFIDTGYAGVDSDDSAADCAGFHACAAAINIGRFVPDHYDVMSIQAPAFQTFGSPCANRAFTYLGQDFGFATLPRARVTANNAVGGTTYNYRGSLWKLQPNGHFASSWSCRKTGGASCGSVSVMAAGFSADNLVANGDGSGDFTWPTDPDSAHDGVEYQFRRTTPPSAPFNAEIGLGIQIFDKSETGGCGQASCQIRDTQTTRTWGDNIGFDAGNAFRQGRLRLSNAVGSELLPLPVPLIAQHWNGQGWAGNTEDNCTALSSPAITFFSQTADNQLSGGETTASFNATLVAGNGNLRFTAPGSGNFGFMDLSVSAPAWLRFNWDGVDQGGDGDVLDDPPRARAAFGKRRGSDKVIIRREIY